MAQNAARRASIDDRVKEASESLALQTLGGGEEVSEEVDASTRPMQRIGCQGLMRECRFFSFACSLSCRFGQVTSGTKTKLN